MFDLFVVDDACFYCYPFITSSAVRENISLILRYALSISFVKVPDYNCFIFLQRLNIINKGKILQSSYYIYSIHTSLYLLQYKT
jgi:hypothetical protein